MCVCVFSFAGASMHTKFNQSTIYTRINLYYYVVVLVIFIPITLSGMFAVTRLSSGHRYTKHIPDLDIPFFFFVLFCFFFCFVAGMKFYLGYSGLACDQNNQVCMAIASIMICV